jgi:hypothetical protein
MVADGEKVGVLRVRLYRPFPSPRTWWRRCRHGARGGGARPHEGARRPRRPAVPRRGGGPGARRQDGERRMPRVIGGRYGLSSKEFTPAMVRAALDELDAAEQPIRGFTVGIVDDVTHLQPVGRRSFDTDHRRAAGRVLRPRQRRHRGANKHTTKIVGEPPAHAQGYFVYDSKKSGSMTVSHLRFDRRPDPLHVPDHRGRRGGRATSSVCSIAPTCCAPPGQAPRSCSTARTARGDVGPPAPRGAAADHRQGPQVHVIDAHRVAREAGLAGPDQHRDAGGVLRRHRR